MNASTLSGFPIVILLTACGDIAEPTNTGGQGLPEPSHTTGAPTATAPRAPPISISGYAHTADGSPLKGVDVCMLAGPPSDIPVEPCASSAGDGSWVLDGIPANMKLTLSFKKEGFAPSIRALETDSDDLVLPADEGRLQSLTDARIFMGASVLPDKGELEFSSTGDATAVTVMLMATGGSTVAPVYLDANGSPDPNATSGVHGGFANLNAGMYAIIFSGETADCETIGGSYGYLGVTYPAPGIAILSVPVLEGYVTTPVRALCKAAPHQGLRR